MNKYRKETGLGLLYTCLMINQSIIKSKGREIMEKLKFGIIGFGFMGHIHEEMITTKLEQGEVVAICDIDKDRMKDAITEGVLKYEKYEDLLAVQEIDTVLIVVPNHLHKEVVIKAAQAGKNIICEKPVAMTTVEMDEMMTAVEANKVRFTVHQQRRFDKDFRTMKEVYDQNLLGDVYTIQSKLYGINGNMHDWHVFMKFGGGMLYDWGVHLIDQLLYMVDSKIMSVYADVRNIINGEVDDYFKILLKFENGVMGEIELGTYYLKDAPRWFERHWFIGGNEGTAYCDGFDPVGKIAKTTRLLENVKNKATMTKAGPTRSFGPPQPGILITEDLPTVEYTHLMFFEDYIDALHNDRPFLVKVDEARRVLALMEAIRKSAATNTLITFEG